MNKELELVKIFHEKFHAPVLNAPSLIPEDRYTHRYRLMDEEVQEYLRGAKNGDLENIAKELSDILYSVYGTVLEHGLQDSFDGIFEEVHNSHMTKEYSEYKMIKGADYVKADLKRFFDGSNLEYKNTAPMSRQGLEEFILTIVRQGMATIRENMGEPTAVIDYLAIFAKDAEEYAVIESLLESLGAETDKENARTGRTFLLNELIETSAGPLAVVKIRKPDQTRPQRGAPDFRVKNYNELKETFLSSSGNFTLMVRKEYEWIEIKGVDVLVYIPSIPLLERLNRRV